MSALAFPPMPTLPRPAAPARPQAPGDRRRHLQAVPDLGTSARGQQSRGDRLQVRAETGQPASSAVAQRPLRLTTRGRRVLIVLAFAAAVAVGAGLGVLFPAESTAPEQVQDVVVSQGESLWAIATSTAAPGQDVREVVEQIRTLNDLDGSTVVAGQRLSVPVG
ncbi:MAG TPA: LysM peptidoglycan-binding domain-containing protein [Beutenbergiaceae bacterium]|nr:LysM peptidoglycan-binding domain-containing protein [Beutenbergiaceae bacterium]